ncbi:MAG: elongation factor G, partial [Planctomycetes bacterium]|nr:elongation factor G [Planctomycetota bacterium]
MCVPIQLPIGAEDNFQGVFNLITLKPEGDAKADSIPQDQIDIFREKLVEVAAEVDDDLTMKYLEGEALTEDEIREALRTGIRENKIVPVLVGSAMQNKNIAELMNAICEFCPSPKDRGKTEAHKGDSQELLDPDENAPTSAFVFKTSTDPYVGKINYIRVFSGAIDADSSIWNSSKSKSERIGQLNMMRGKTQEPIARLVAGDIGVVTKLAETSTGDTISSQDNSVTFDPIKYPVP